MSRKALVFLGLTLAASWLMAWLFFLIGGTWNTPSAYAMAVAYMFVPAVAAIVVQGVLYRQPLKKPLGISVRLNRWFLVAWLLPVVIALMAFGISLLFPGVEFSPGMEGMFERLSSFLAPEQIEEMRNQMATARVNPIWLGVVQALVAGVTVNAIAGFGEELGWRGLLQLELRTLGFWRSSGLTGLIWGIWHAPIILRGHNYPDHPLVGVFMMILFTLLLSPLFSYVRLRAGSVLAAAVLHGSLNASTGLAVMLLKGGNDLTVGVTGAAGFVALILANLAILLHDRYLAAEPIDSVLRQMP